MERLVKNIKPVDPLLSDLYYWFKIADDFHLGKLPLMSGINPLNWLEVLEKNCDPKSYGPGCALFVRKKLDSGSADIQSIEHLSESKFSEEKFRLIMQAVNIEECNPFLLFLFCEVKFYFSAPEKTGDWKNVNKRLEFFNVNKVSDWSWIPLYDLKTPCGQKALDILIEQYSDLLSDPFIEFDKTKKIPAIFYLVKIRLLSGIVQKNNSSDFKSLENFIKSIRDKSILEASYEITFKIFDKNEELIKIYLEHPDVTEKSIFTENLVTNAVGFTGDFMKTALVDFAFREGWGTEKGDYGIWNKLTLYFAKVLEPRVIDKLVPLKGSSGLGSAFEIAIINLGERYSDKIDDFSFNTALFHLLSDGFTDYKLVFFENRCKKYLCELATSKNLNDVQIAAYGVSRIIDAKKTSFKITIDLLISFVLIIADAVSQARSNSGETWEDRNWGGYNMSGEESFAENISCAIKNLSILKYEKDDLDKLKKRLDFINLSNIVLVDATSYSIDYVAFDLEKALGL
ncbi:MAG TPA: hypothetical protein PK771_01420 [Spirochaetota bacterium]|mgnify:CR=1 FL=1|nr:hypothetical protein [Spirochaetota bacterium]